MRRAVVFGAGGLLGRHLVDELVRRGVVVAAHPHGSVAVEDLDQVRAAAAGASHLFNCAGYTDVDRAERDADAAFLVNALGAENVAIAAVEADAVVIHVSTDFVFGGDRPTGSWDEWDVPSPRSLYARSKRAGEILVERAAPRSHVVRVQGLYGDGGRSFSSRLPRLLLAGQRGMRLDNQRRVQPTWAGAAARALVEIAESGRFGTWHASCRGATTWHRFALLLARRLDVVAGWTAVPTAELGLAAERPENCLLAHRRIAMCGLPLMPTWEQALDEYLQTSSELRAALGGSP